MNDTKEHKMALIQNLTDHQRFAIFCRAEGVKFQDIADSIDTSVSTVKNWFREGTGTSWAYKEYSRERASEMCAEALHKARMLAKKAIEVQEELMGDDMPPSIRFRASSYILDKDIPQALLEEEARYFYELDNKDK